MVPSEYERSISDAAAREAADIEREMIVAIAKEISSSRLGRSVIALSSAALRRRIAKIVAGRRGELQRAMEEGLHGAFLLNALDELTRCEGLSRPASEMAAASASRHAAKAGAKVGSADRVLEGMAADANAKYVRYASRAVVRASAVGRTKALREAVVDMASEGVSAFTYTQRDGRQVSVSADVGVRRVMNDAVRSQQLEQTLEIAGETGNDLVEVNSTANCRESHASWQGKVYMLSGSSARYDNFYSACRYGDLVRGIGGYNCGHKATIYFPGHRRVFKDPLEGTGYTTEEARGLVSRQRRYEREIRKQKRVIEALRASGMDASSERARLRETQRRLGVLVEGHSILGRQRDYREGIFERSRKGTRA